MTTFTEIMRKDKYAEIYAYLLSVAKERREERLNNARKLFSNGGIFDKLRGKGDDMFISDLNEKRIMQSGKSVEQLTESKITATLQTLA